jgi:hypothetical protein
MIALSSRNFAGGFIPQQDFAAYRAFSEGWFGSAIAQSAPNLKNATIWF